MQQKQIDFIWIKWKKNPFNSGNSLQIILFERNIYRNEQEVF